MMKHTKFLLLVALAMSVAIGLQGLDGSNSVVRAQDGVQKTNSKNPSTPTTSDQSAVRAAIDQTTQSFVEAFSRGDVDRVAAHLSEGAELISDEAPPLRGRDAIVKALTNHFAENPKKTIVREVESLRFKSKLAVTEEGLLKVSVESEAPKHMRYSLDLIHEDAKWLIVAVHEWPEKNADLMDLEWLIGTWEAKRADAEVLTTYEWFGSKAYIRATISLREKDQTVSTMQMIGIDPRSDELRILTFEADGGFAEGTCTREGNTWIFESHGVLTDGGELSAKNILVRVDSDTTTWQPISLQLGDETIEGIPPLKMTRVKPEK
jgi:uncharacterized protein (TIGR02246 family)